MSPNAASVVGSFGGTKWLVVRSSNAPRPLLRKYRSGPPRKPCPTNSCPAFEDRRPDRHPRPDRPVPGLVGHEDVEIAVAVDVRKTGIGADIGEDWKARRQLRAAVSKDAEAIVQEQLLAANLGHDPVQVTVAVHIPPVSLGAVQILGRQPRGALVYEVAAAGVDQQLIRSPVQGVRALGLVDIEIAVTRRCPRDRCREWMSLAVRGCPSAAWPPRRARSSAPGPVCGHALVRLTAVPESQA
jgi:hypothetical protein